MAIPVDAVTSVVEPIVTGAGFDLEGVSIATVGRRDKVTVTVDADGGVSLDSIADMSTAISAALDAREDLAPFPYVLEVTSPGVDRPLTEPRHWRRAKDRLVAIELADGEAFTGRVRGSDDSTVTVVVDADEHTVAITDVSRAVVQVEFDRKDS